METFGYTGRGYKHYGDTVTAESIDDMSHNLTIKDDYGNIKETIHFSGSKDSAMRYLRDNNFDHKLSGRF